MLSKFLDPKNDFAFRKIFGTEKNKKILIHFLNDVLTPPAGLPIQDVTFLKTVQDPDIASLKTSIVDILCRDTKGVLFIVEMQVAKTHGFEKRAQYYAAKAYISQMKVKEEYYNLKEVIFLAIVDFVMFPDKQDYKSEHVILDNKTYQRDLKDFSFTFLELPKYNIPLEKLSNNLERWCYFFNHAEDTTEKEFESIVEIDAALGDAYQELNRFSWSQEELLAYEQQIKREKDYRASMDQKYIEGKEEGVSLATREIVKNMQRANCSRELIAQVTGFSISDIEKMQQN